MFCILQHYLWFAFNPSAVQFGTSSTYLTLLYSVQFHSISAVLQCGMNGKDKKRACCCVEGRQTHTGRFIMYCGNCKYIQENRRTHIYQTCTDRRKNQTFSLVSCFSSYFTFLPLGDASVCSEKMVAQREKSFCVLEYYKNKSQFY